jgi:hypothetical protein
MSYILNSKTNINCLSKLELLSLQNKNLQDINNITNINGNIFVYDGENIVTRNYEYTIYPTEITTDFVIQDYYHNHIIYKIDSRNVPINLVITLPSAEITREFIFNDIYGISATKNIYIAPNTSDTINGLSNDIIININYKSIHLLCIDNNKWITI